jgi:mono/diheme cytochrome c family protein
MKKFLKIGSFLVSAVLLIAAAVILYISLAYPNVGDPDPDFHVESTPELIERGAYLANHVMLCIDCHSKRDFTLFAGPLVPGTEASGGERFTQQEGFPGLFISPNITPYGIGDWTDGELLRLITTGVNKDGDAIFPVMPYHSYGKADIEDIKAVIAYVRSLPPAEVTHPRSKADFPFNFILKTLPEKASFSKMPDPADQVAYGGYLTTISGCGDCHTKFEKGNYVGSKLAGGREFDLGYGILTSPNLTPHESGIGNWDEDQFVQRFRHYSPSHYIPENISEGDFQTIMPWIMYADMHEEDLKAIFAYLQSLPAVPNFIEKFKPST